jgi:hypothetical protein
LQRVEMPTLFAKSTFDDIAKIGATFRRMSE